MARNSSYKIVKAIEHQPGAKESDHRIINSEVKRKALEAAEKGQATMIGNDALEWFQKVTQPIAGYKQHQNFPNCCSYHKSLLKCGQEAYNQFPNCCEAHRNLNSASWFNKAQYGYVPQKLVVTVSYTWHCIETYIDHENWFKLVGDYIVYTQESYGALPTGFGPPLGLADYFNAIKKRLEQNSALPSTKCNQLIELIERLEMPAIPHETEALPDINLLVRMYDQWVSEFPFELSFFSHLKPYFEKNKPVLKRVGDNLYFGSIHTLRTYDELLDWVIDATQNLLKEINALRLHKEGKLNDIASLELEYILAERQQQLDRGYFNASPDSKTRYRRILKAWLKDERKFVKKLTSNLSKDHTRPSQEPQNNQETYSKPAFKEDTIATVFDLLKDFFPQTQQKDLLALITEQKKPKGKLLFRGNGNRLADAFKQLYEANFIIGCQKKELEQWIAQYFQYQFRADIKSFTPRYLQDIISTESDKCKTPLLNVTKDKTTGRYVISQA